MGSVPNEACRIVRPHTSAKSQRLPRSPGAAAVQDVFRLESALRALASSHANT